MSVDMILLDWTRMGKTYCLAGVIVQNNEYRIVRPLPPAARASAVTNVGWSPYLIDGHCRWEVFELVHPEPAQGQAPHLEDIYVKEMRSKRFLAGTAERRAILEATVTPADQPLFGFPLTQTRTAGYLQAGTGSRSLSSVIMPTKNISFTVAEREGTGEIDYRVTLDLPDLPGRILPLKDHALLQRAELASNMPAGQTRELQLALRQMGEQVVVRLGLSRSFRSGEQQTEGVCWLMADGFFSLNDPQP